MADETDHIRVSNKITKDCSAEKAVATNKRAVSVPHYLRASTGSCHDACKYGKPHVFIEKPWKTVRRRMSAPLPDAENTVEIRIFLDKKVKKSNEADSLERVSKEGPAAIDKIRRSSPLLRRSPVHDSSKVLKNEIKPVKRSPSAEPPKVMKKVIRSPSAEPPKVMKKVIRSPGRLSLPDASKLSKQEVASAATKDVSSRRTPSIPKGRSVSAGIVRRNGINGMATRASLSPDMLIGSSGKQSSISKFTDLPRSSKITVRKSLTPAATTLSVKRSPTLEVKKPLGPPLTAMSSLRSPVVSGARSNTVGKINGISRKDQNQRNQASTKKQILTVKAEFKEPVDETEEKTLHMIETIEDRLPTILSASHFMQSPSPLSPESLNSSSQANSLSFTSHEVDEQYELDTDQTESDTEDSVSNYNGCGDSKAVDSLQRNSRNTCSSVHQDPTSLKLKFRRGKVVDLQSGSNSPRKLRFRQGKNLDDDKGAELGSRRKSFRKQAAANNKKEADAGVVQVALKHQEVMAKDEQVSFNNVIEETASKLVEKKKSKVKALVGAFETVISLQERKPSAAHR